MICLLYTYKIMIIFNRIEVREKLDKNKRSAQKKATRKMWRKGRNLRRRAAGEGSHQNETGHRNF